MNETATKVASPSRARGVAGFLVVLAVDVALLAWGVGGFAALGSHARALALLALWAVGSAALAWLRPVKQRDPVDNRGDGPLVLATLFLVPLLSPALSARAERAGLWLLPARDVVGWAGVAISGLGYALRIVAMRRLGSRFSPLIEVQRRHALETDGVYGRIRHPGYLGAWLATLGAIVAFGSAATLPLAVAMALALESRMRREEELLERRFGDEWRVYRGRTGRFLPKIGA